MKKINYYLSILLLFVAFGCQTSDIETVPEIPKMKAQYKNPDALPEVMSQLNSALKTNLGDNRGSANTDQVITSIGKISIDRIFEVIDTVNNSNYTFLVEDEDNNPFTFTNLVLKKRQDGDWDMPYLIDYKVDSAEIPQFIESGFSMANFTGTTTKRFLKDFSFGPRSSANLEQRARVSDPSQCDQQTGYEGGNSGGSPDNPPNNEPPSGGGYTSFCYHYIEEIEVDACGTQISGTTGVESPDFENNGCSDADYHNALYGNGSGKTKTITVRRTYCYTIGSSYSIGDPDACPQPETEDVGILSPGLEGYFYHVESISDPKVRALEQIRFISGNADPEDRDAAQVLSEMLLDRITNGTDQEVDEVIKAIDQLWNQVKAKTLMLLFDPETIATVLSFGIGNQVINTTTRQAFFRTIARHTANSIGKGFSTFEKFKNAYGAAGTGKAWHHIVSQRASNITRFGAEKIHNTNNLIKLPNGAGTWHQRITNFYNTISPNGINTNGLRFGEWVSQKSFQEQMEWGLKVMEWMK
ncbi:hypothetical protein ACV07N_08405 [Roseivirga echinicomitans]